MSLKVADEEFWRGAERIRDISDELLDIFVLYEKIIHELIKKGICDVQINNVLLKKVDTLRKHAKSLENISDKVVALTYSFIDDIDQADSYLYD